MNIGLLNMLKTVEWDFRRDLAQTYADALKNAIELHIDNDVEKHEGFFLSAKGCSQARGNFEDKLYFGNIHYVENHLRYNDEELQEDDQIINVVYIDGPVTRDGGACSYGTKEYRDQVMYANNIPQVVFHLFIVNTPGGESACRNDYDMMIADCRKNNKPTVMFVDGQCCSSGVNLGCRCDCVVVMNPKDDFGCIGSMAAFWATPDGAVDSRDGSRFIEIVGDQSPDKNGWYRKAAEGDYEELKELINKDTEEFHQTVRENRPLVEDWMLTGKVFEAQELIPALVDEIGDLNRAIECGFELANQTRTAARFMTAEPKNEPEEKPEGEEPEEMAKLTEQQKAAVATSRGDLRVVDNGHVKKEEQGFFGPVTVEVAQPQNQENMKEEEKKAKEAAAAQAEQEQEAAVQAQEGQQADEGAQQEQHSEEGAQQEQASEEGQQQAQEEEAPAGEQSQEGQQNQEEQAAEEGQQEQQSEEGAQQEQQAEEHAPASEEAVQAATEDIDKIQETLHNAEQMIADKDKEIADKDKEIAELKESLDGQKNTAEQLQADIDQARKDIETANGTIAERDATIAARDKSIEEKDALIDQLKKQIADLKAEVKELAGKPAPMTDAAAGIPQDNGTGEAPKQTGSGITSDMDYKEIRERVKKNAAEKAAKKKVE